MGSSTKTYQDLQVIPVMDTYNDLDKTLLRYNYQQISKGMDAVLKARHKTMFDLRTTMKPTVMKKWGFKTESTAQMQKIDNDLILDYLQTNVDPSISSIVDSNVGLATYVEQGHMYLQSIYDDYSIDTRTFVYPTDGQVYMYDSTTLIGNNTLNILSYRQTDNTPLYFEIPNAESVGSLETYINGFAGKHRGLSTQGWRYGTAEPYNYGLGEIPPNKDENLNYTSKIILYDIERSITDIGNLIYQVVCTATNVSPNDPDIIAAVEGYEKTKVSAEIANYADSNYKNIVVTYIKGEHQYLYEFQHLDAQQFFVLTNEPTLPIFPLKTGGVLNSNNHIKVALREMGMTGKEFDNSIADSKIKYAALGFMFDANIDDPITTKLMYETFIYLRSTNTIPGKFGASGVGYQLSFGDLMVNVIADYTVTAISGSIGPVGSYNSTITPYTVSVQEYVSHGEDSGYQTTTVTRTRRIYRKQETTDYYVELNISNLGVSHTYKGVSDIPTSFMDVIQKVKNGTQDLDRIPILRTVLTKLPFNEYVKMLQMSMTLIVYTKVVVKTKWYQSGIFKFFIAVAAVAISIVSWGAASTAGFSLLSTTVAVGATATAVLAVASAMGINLGVLGKVLQVVAIIGAVAGIYTMMLSPKALTSTQLGAGPTVAKTGVSTATKGVSVATHLEDGYLVGQFTELSEGFTELASQFNIESMGFISTTEDVLSPEMSAISSSIENISSDMTGGLMYGVDVTVPIAEPSMLDQIMGELDDNGITKDLQIANKTAGVVKDINGMLNQSKLEALQANYKKLANMQKLTEAALQDLRDSKHQALMLAPTDIETMFDRVTTVPDPMAGMDDLHATLMQSVDMTEEQMIWA